METNPPRNSRLRLIRTDEQWGVGAPSLPGLSDIGRKDRLCLRKLTPEPDPAYSLLTKQTVAPGWLSGMMIVRDCEANS